MGCLTDKPIQWNDTPIEEVTFKVFNGVEEDNSQFKGLPTPPEPPHDEYELSMSTEKFYWMLWKMREQKKDLCRAK